MFLKYIQIVNYKNLKSSRFEFAKGANTVIGENDAGKSNAMTAIRILLDSDFYYNTKRLKESDFSNALGEWKGHWIIVSAFFDEISTEDRTSELCAELTPVEEDTDFLKSYIRCAGYDYGVVTLFIRPIKSVRQALASAETKEIFNKIRGKIKLTDYEFYYTARSQADFINESTYKKIVGDIENGIYVNPEEEDTHIIGSKINILNVWQHVSLEFIDALRDVENELRKPKNPIRRVLDAIQHEIADDDIEAIKMKIKDLNNAISSVKQVADIGFNVNKKLHEIIGLIYSPEIAVESRLKEDLNSFARQLVVSPTDQTNIDFLGLGHLNMLYIALKLVEFEYNRNHEIINIMIVEEPEAHIHTHIQKTLFNNLNVSKEYTQVIMTTHSTHLSEVADIRKVNILKAEKAVSSVMQPINCLDEFGRDVLHLRDLPLSTCLERYLDAKRSVLLFSKGIILVEGDGEEILLPSIIKKSLGVSLDEIGIGLVNVGSVAFANIACIFSSERLQRYCAIVTDYDAVMPEAKKSKETAAKRGETRKEHLTEIFKENRWVDSFYAPYTFEVDFANEEDNRKFIKKIIELHYKDENTIKKHLAALDGTVSARYDSVLIVANEIGKGWFATLLSTIIDETVQIPEYLLRAIVYASKDVLNEKILWKMLLYSLNQYGKFQEEDVVQLRRAVETAKSTLDQKKCVDYFCNVFPDDVFSLLVQYRKV